MIDSFYSDPHFGHAKVLEHCARPFADVDEMNRELIARYNAHVRDVHTVPWLGDCFFGPPAFGAAILAALNGSKILVPGNHDGSAARMARSGFHAVTNAMTMHIAGEVVRVQHIPGAVNEGEYVLHGHLHAK